MRYIETATRFKIFTHTHARTLMGGQIYLTAVLLLLLFFFPERLGDCVWGEREREKLCTSTLRPESLMLHTLNAAAAAVLKIWQIFFCVLLFYP
jgi:hypothetical protein